MIMLNLLKRLFGWFPSKKGNSDIVSTEQQKGVTNKLDKLFADIMSENSEVLALAIIELSEGLVFSYKVREKYFSDVMPDNLAGIHSHLYKTFCDILSLLPEDISDNLKSILLVTGKATFTIEVLNDRYLLLIGVTGDTAIGLTRVIIESVKETIEEILENL